MLSQSRQSQLLSQRNFNKLDILIARVKPFQLARQRSIRRTLSSGLIGCLSYQIYSRDSAQPRANPENSNPFVKLQQNTEQLAHFSRLFVLEQQRRQNLRNKIADLTRGIAQQRKLIMVMTGMQGKHINQTNTKIERIQKLKSEKERAASCASFQRREVIQLEQGCKYLKAQLKQINLQKKSEQQLIEKLRSDLSELKVAVLQSDKDKQQQRAQLVKSTKALDILAIQHAAEEQKKADQLLYVALYTRKK